ncbi:MAG: class I SAM-dependent methyltransferase [Armatimonadota bacterium]|nr:class I SAM-dependent methyltransferase [Armatimonadota bacterium]
MMKKVINSYGQGGRSRRWSLFGIVILLVAMGQAAVWIRLRGAGSFLLYPNRTAILRLYRPVSPLFSPALADALLEEPERDRWQQPVRLVETLKIQRGDTVADIGAGSGYLLPYLSRAVGPQGRVYAEEIQAAFLPRLKERARRLGNVTVVLGTAGNPQLPRNKIDLFVLLTVYHEVQAPVQFLRTLRAFGKPGTRLAIIDFDASRRGYPPAPPGHDVWEQDVLAEARAAGWNLLESQEFLSSQFFLVFGRS